MYKVLKKTIIVLVTAVLMFTSMSWDGIRVVADDNNGNGTELVDDTNTSVEEEPVQTDSESGDETIVVEVPGDDEVTETGEGETEVRPVESGETTKAEDKDPEAAVVENNENEGEVENTEPPVEVIENTDPVEEQQPETEVTEPVEQQPEETRSENPVTEVEEVKMPATVLEGKAGKVTVKVTVPEGALPEGVEMLLELVPKANVEDLVNENVDGTVKDFVAVDITFVHGEEKVEPRKAISVQMNVFGFDSKSEKTVLHIDDEENVNVLTEAETESSPIATKATFESDRFSIYIIVSGDEIVTFRRTYQFINEVDAEGNTSGPYEFLNKAGETVDNQIIKNGDILEPVGNPYISGKTLLGWYLVTESNGKYTYTDTKVDFDVAISDVTKDETVYVAPKYEAVYYVSFHETAKGTAAADDIIRTKKIVVTSGEAAGKCLISDVIAPQPDESHIFYGWYVGDETTPHNIYDANKQIQETYLTGIESDLDLYPNFVEAYWLRFVAGEVGSGSVYVESQFVLASDGRISSLPVTTRKGYSFDGWYTGSQDSEGKIIYGDQVTDGNGNVINPTSGLVITEETTLYGH